MRLIKYSISGGYEDVDYGPEFPTGMSDQQWLVVAGFEIGTMVTDRVRDDPDRVLLMDPEVVVYWPKEESSTRRIVEVRTGEDSHFVLVETLSDLLHLRLALAPLHLLALGMRLDSLVTVAEKTFRLSHGHDAYESCEACDPERERLKEEIAGMARDDDGGPKAN